MQPDEEGYAPFDEWVAEVIKRVGVPLVPLGDAAEIARRTGQSAELAAFRSAAHEISNLESRILVLGYCNIRGMDAEKMRRARAVLAALEKQSRNLSQLYDDIGHPKGGSESALDPLEAAIKTLREHIELENDVYIESEVQRRMRDYAQAIVTDAPEPKILRLAKALEPYRHIHAGVYRLLSNDNRGVGFARLLARQGMPTKRPVGGEKGFIRDEMLPVFEKLFGSITPVSRRAKAGPDNIEGNRQKYYDGPFLRFVICLFSARGHEVSAKTVYDAVNGA